MNLIKIITFFLLGVLFTSCSSWKGAYIQFQDEFYKTFRPSSKILVLPPNSLVYRKEEGKYVVDNISRIEDGNQLQYLINQEWVEKHENIFWAKKIEEQKPNEFLELTQLQEHILQINHSQNLVDVTYDKLKGRNPTKELFVSDPVILPVYQNVIKSYNSDLVGVFYTFTGKKNKNILCFTLVDLKKDRIVYRVFSTYDNYEQAVRAIVGIKKDIGL
ncbi:MAG: hypothetical protein ACPGEG_00380 [Salibacteraceae bacterium]